MGRPLLSVRFPAPLANALDDLAQKQQWSRSDLVEKLIEGITVDDREEILQTRLSGPPTERLNFRLSPETVDRLRDLASDVGPAEFLRRTVACAVEGVQGSDLSRPNSTQARSGRRPERYAATGQPVVVVPRGASLLIFLAILVALGAFAVFHVWRIRRMAEPPTAPPTDANRGQLGTGDTAGKDA
jgi:hypothetical protein